VLIIRHGGAEVLFFAAVRAVVAVVVLVGIQYDLTRRLSICLG